MPSKACLTPGCPNPATYRGRCSSCNPANERSIARAGKAIYSTKRWRLLRRRVLFEQPICAECPNLSEHVDHVVPIEDGGAPFARTNLQGLCATHHSRKTRREQIARAA